MRSPDALAAALAMVQSPQLVRLARNAPLPRGITFLLEVAASDSDALRDASGLMGQPAPLLQKAAAFFVEQIMLSPHSDTYRTLGAQPGISQRELRHHLALLMKWLHPDIVGSNGATHGFDPRLYASRVAEAWDAIKSQHKRAGQEAPIEAAPPSQSVEPGNRQLQRRAFSMRGKRRRRLIIYRLRSETFWLRLVTLLGRSR